MKRFYHSTGHPQQIYWSGNFDRADWRAEGKSLNLHWPWLARFAVRILNWLGRP